MIYRRRAEVEMGLTAARAQAQQLEDAGEVEVVAEECVRDKLGYKEGLPIALYNFAARSELQKIQCSRMNQREKCSFQRGAWAERGRYFKRQLRSRLRRVRKANREMRSNMSMLLMVPSLGGATSYRLQAD